MKYLEIDALNRLNLKLSSLERPDCTRLQARAEAYTCKPAGEDKKLYKLLEQKFGCETTIIRKRHRPNQTQNPNPTPPQSSEDEEPNQAQSRKRLKTEDDEGARQASYAEALSEVIVGKTSQEEACDAHQQIPETRPSSSSTTSTTTTFEHTPESLLLYHILGTLQLAEPDFDCSGLDLSHFAGPFPVRKALAAVDEGEEIWSAVAGVLGEVEADTKVWTLKDESLLDDGVPDIWCKRFFLVNKKKKRVVYLSYRLHPVTEYVLEDTGYAVPSGINVPLGPSVASSSPSSPSCGHAQSQGAEQATRRTGGDTSTSCPHATGCGGSRVPISPTELLSTFKAFSGPGAPEEIRHKSNDVVMLG